MARRSNMTAAYRVLRCRGMEGPARGVRFIHEAINREAAELERLATQGDATAIAARLPFFKRVLHLHTSGEERSVFADLATHLPDVPAAYVLDHRVDEAHVAELEAALAEGGPRVARAVIALREHLRLHIRKEEELLVPLLEKLFTPEEQGAQIGRMMAQFTPDDLAAILPWMITWLDPADRRAYLGIAERAMPPERFGGVLQLLRGAVAPDVWQSLGR
jgi:hypothetical protein